MEYDQNEMRHIVDEIRLDPRMRSMFEGSVVTHDEDGCRAIIRLDRPGGECNYNYFFITWLDIDDTVAFIVDGWSVNDALSRIQKVSDSLGHHMVAPVLRLDVKDTFWDEFMNPEVEVRNKPLESGEE